MVGGPEMIDPKVKSKLSLDQIEKLEDLERRNPRIDIDRLSRIIAEDIFEPKFNVPNLAKAVDLIGPIATDSSQSLWFYSDGVWQCDKGSEIVRRVELCTGARYRKDHVTQVLSLLTARPPEINGPGPEDLLNLRNGMLEWRTGTLLPHSPDHYSTYQLPIEWDPQATCPTIDQWFADMFDFELQPLLYEIIGVSWYPRQGFQKLVVLLGDGYNGKGTFLRLIQAGLPDGSWSSVDPVRLAENRFAAAQLFGKVANFCGDIESFTLKATGELKKLSGDDYIYAEHKNGRPFEFQNHATMIFAANVLPMALDESLGWKRRLLVVPMQKQIVGNPDRNLEKRMHEELPGLLNHAVRHLTLAQERGGLLPISILPTDIQIENCSAFTYIDEMLTYDPKWTTPINRYQLYEGYRSYCGVKGLVATEAQWFYSAIETRFGSVTSLSQPRNGSGQRHRSYRGIRPVTSYVF